MLVDSTSTTLVDFSTMKIMTSATCNAISGSDVSEKIIGFLNSWDKKTENYKRLTQIQAVAAKFIVDITVGQQKWEYDYSVQTLGDENDIFVYGKLIEAVVLDLLNCTSGKHDDFRIELWGLLKDKRDRLHTVAISYNSVNNSVDFYNEGWGSKEDRLRYINLMLPRTQNQPQCDDNLEFICAANRGPIPI